MKIGQRNTTDFSQRLPLDWTTKVDPADQQWIGQSLFKNKGSLNDHLKSWWYPSQLPAPSFYAIPSVASYYLKRLFLWMPRRMWSIDLICPRCHEQQKRRVSLTSKGLYSNVRQVVDVNDCYYLEAEYYECPNCRLTIIATNQSLLDQLNLDVRQRFLIILTRKYSTSAPSLSFP